METIQEHINKDMTIGDVISKHPTIAPILLKHGLHCVGCHVSAFETIEQGVLGHGMPEEKLHELLKDANEFLSKQPVQEKSDRVSVTETAAKKLQEFATKENKQGHGLKLTVLQGGCSGSMYDLTFQETAGEGEITFEEHGIKIFVNQKEFDQIKGTIVDYVDGLHGSGFDVKNPNATSTCGCGKSFN
jgi:iron-sulfur cluster assembly accessory protein